MKNKSDARVTPTAILSSDVGLQNVGFSGESKQFHFLTTFNNDFRGYTRFSECRNLWSEILQINVIAYKYYEMHADTLVLFVL